MTRFILATAIVALIAPSLAAAQQTPPRRTQAIEIRGQVPTPQVVTVRPREVPNYDRRVLVPTFYDHDFWQSILPAYLLVREHMITGTVPGDNSAARAPTSGPPPATTRPPGSAPPPPPPGPDAPAVVPPPGTALPPR